MENRRVLASKNQVCEQVNERHEFKAQSYQKHVFLLAHSSYLAIEVLPSMDRGHNSPLYAGWYTSDREYAIVGGLTGIE
jgi:hypothetical protein